MIEITSINENSQFLSKLFPHSRFWLPSDMSVNRNRQFLSTFFSDSWISRSKSVNANLESLIQRSANLKTIQKMSRDMKAYGSEDSKKEFYDAIVSSISPSPDRNGISYFFDLFG
jgi:hypothetical protein